MVRESRDAGKATPAGSGSPERHGSRASDSRRIGASESQKPARAVDGSGLRALVDEVRSLVNKLVESGHLSAADAEVAVSAFEDRLPDEADPTNVLGPYFNTAGLRRRLGVTRQALNGRISRNTMLGVKADDQSILYPSWQFRPDMAVVDGLPQLLQVLSKAAPDGFSQAVWLSSPQERFGQRSAADLLVAGSDLAPLLEAARADVASLER